MSCSLDYSILQTFPKSGHAIFMSSVESVGTQTDAHIANTDQGYFEELEHLGQDDSHSTAPGSHVLNATSTGPYSTRLRPVGNMSVLLAAPANSILLTSAEFFIYSTLNDQTNYVPSSGIQDQVKSLPVQFASKSKNNIYAVSGIWNGLMPTWVPNYFRPEIRINNENFIRGLDTSAFGNGNNKGDLSIGLPNPYCVEIFEVVTQMIQSFDVFAGATQRIMVDNGPTYYYQRYPVLCLLHYRY